MEISETQKIKQNELLFKNQPLKMLVSNKELLNKCYLITKKVRTLISGYFMKNYEDETSCAFRNLIDCKELRTTACS